MWSLLGSNPKGPCVTCVTPSKTHQHVESVDTLVHGQFTVVSGADTNLWQFAGKPTGEQLIAEPREELISGCASVTA